MKVLVTGSSGQLGSYICESMAGEYEVSGLDIAPSRHASTKDLTALGDIRDAGDASRAVSGVDVVVHCAAQVSVERSTEDPATDAHTNVLGTVNMLHASARSGVKRFVYISSAAVYGNPRSVPISEDHPTEPMSNYGASKLAGEKFTLAFGHTTPMEVVVMRPFNFYSSRADPKSPYSGVITKFVERVRMGEPPMIEGDGQQTRDFIHARDVAAMTVLLLAAEGVSGKVFNCGSGQSTSILELARTAISASGRNLKPAFTTPRKGDIRHSLADVSSARDALRFSPKVSLSEGISELLR
ncbi:MAG TPA: NAD-dependent epimerase/dehydratase family protein [Thermoplasmata archaeon]|nr:NAD-dependent epimerase/dehydratase family protein [Thermoplasmata archaeon]